MKGAAPFRVARRVNHAQGVAAEGNLFAVLEKTRDGKRILRLAEFLPKHHPEGLELAGQLETFGMMFGEKFGKAEDPLPVARFLKDGEKISFGRHALRVIHTP